MGLLESHGRGRQLLRCDELSLDAPVIVIHSLAHAVAALSAAAEAGRTIIVASAPGAGIYGGPGWWRELLTAARDAVPTARVITLLDCDDDPSAAQAAIRAGIEAIVLTGRADVAERVADVAGQRGTRLFTNRPATDLDLGDSFFAPPEALRQRCAALLAGD